MSRLRSAGADEPATWSAWQIESAGFVNLDFRRDVGHSATGERWGFKHEDIFGFDAAGHIEEL